MVTAVLLQVTEDAKNKLHSITTS